MFFQVRWKPFSTVCCIYDSHHRRVIKITLADSPTDHLTLHYVHNFIHNSTMFNNIKLQGDGLQDRQFNSDTYTLLWRHKLCGTVPEWHRDAREDFGANTSDIFMRQIIGVHVNTWLMLLKTVIKCTHNAYRLILCGKTLLQIKVHIKGKIWAVDLIKRQTFLHQHHVMKEHYVLYLMNLIHYGDDLHHSSINFMDTTIVGVRHHKE